MTAINNTRLQELQKDLIGSARNYYPDKTPFYVSGKATGVNNARVDVCEYGTAINLPAAPIQMQLVSSGAGAAGDAAAGTGVRQVVIHYLDTAYAVQSEVVIMNGGTPVNTVATNILRVNGLHAYTVGSGGVAAGTILLQAVGGATTYGQITVGFTASRAAVFTIPAGKTGYIDFWNFSTGAASGSHFTAATLRATCHEGVLLSGVFIMQDEVGALNNCVPQEYAIPIKVPATADIKVSTISDAANANASITSRFSGWYE